MDFMTAPNLPLENMDERHDGLTSNVAGYYYDAARVCLDRHHSSPIEFALWNEKEESKTRLEWVPADDKIRRAYANEIDATEAGACACTIAAVELTKGLVAVHRAETTTGADYYVGPVGEKFEDLENCLRLEISGTDKGSSDLVKRRLQEKVDQALTGNSNLPALAAVIGFQERLIMIKAAEKSP